MCVHVVHTYLKEESGDHTLTQFSHHTTRTHMANKFITDIDNERDHFFSGVSSNPDADAVGGGCDCVECHAQEEVQAPAPPPQQTRDADALVYCIVPVCGGVPLSERYVGSTTKKIGQRAAAHRLKARKFPNRLIYRRVQEAGGWDNVTFVVIEEVWFPENLTNAQSRKYHLHRRERHHIQECAAAWNRTIPMRSIDDNNKCGCGVRRANCPKCGGVAYIGRIASQKKYRAAIRERRRAAKAAAAAGGGSTESSE